MENRRPTVKRQTIKRQTTMNNIPTFGNTQISLLQGIFDTASQKNPSMTPSVVRTVLDQFKEFINLEFTPVYQLLDNMSTRRIIYQQEFVTWVKISYIVIFRQMNPQLSIEQISRFALKLLEGSFSPQVTSSLLSIITSQLTTNSNVLDVILRSGLDLGNRKKKSSINQAEPGLTFKAEMIQPEPRPQIFVQPQIVQITDSPAEVTMEEESPNKELHSNIGRRTKKILSIKHEKPKLIKYKLDTQEQEKLTSFNPRKSTDPFNGILTNFPDLEQEKSFDMSEYDGKKYEIDLNKQKKVQIYAKPKSPQMLFPQAPLVNVVPQTPVQPTKIIVKIETEQQKKKEQPVQSVRVLRQILSPGNGEPEDYKPMIVKSSHQTPTVLKSAEIPLKDRKNKKLESPFTIFYQTLVKKLEPYISLGNRNLPTFKMIIQWIDQLISLYQEFIISKKSNKQDPTHLYKVIQLLKAQKQEILNQLKDFLRFYKKKVPLHQIHRLIKILIQQAESLLKFGIQQKFQTSSVSTDIDLLSSLLDSLKPILQQASKQKQDIFPTLLIILSSLEHNLQQLKYKYTLNHFQTEATDEISAFTSNYIRQIPIKPQILQHQQSELDLQSLIQKTIHDSNHLRSKRRNLGEDEQDIDITIKQFQHILGELKQNQPLDPQDDPRRNRIRDFTIQIDFPKAVAQQVKLYQALQEQRERLKEQPEQINILLDPLKEELFKLTNKEIEVSPPLLSHAIPPQDFNNCLQESIKDFSKLRKQLRHNEQETDDCDYILGLFRQALSRPPLIKKKVAQPVTQEKYRMGLLDIFEFYARQPSLADPSPKLKQLSINKLYIKIGKFLSFCRDFALIKTKRMPGLKMLTRQQLVKIYYENADQQKSMYEQNFILAIDEIAQLFFDKQYDKINKTDWKNLSFKQKVFLIYEYLQCDDPLKYGRKMKGYGNPYYVGGARRLREDTNTPAAAHMKSTSPQSGWGGLTSGRSSPIFSRFGTPNQFDLMKSLRGSPIPSPIRFGVSSPLYKSGGSPEPDYYRKKPTLNRFGGSPQPFRSPGFPERTNSNSTSGQIKSSQNSEIQFPRSPQNSYYTRTRNDLSERLRRETLSRAEKLEEASRRKEAKYLKRVNDSGRLKYGELRNRLH